MPQFTYLGDHESVTLWGITFPQGVAVSVSDEHAIGKLRGNNHFSEVVDGAEVMPDEPKQKRKYTRRGA
jgi:hypothetical protein